MYKGINCIVCDLKIEFYFLCKVNEFDENEVLYMKIRK